MLASAATPQRIAVIVAHPDDETLWCGGQILQHPAWSWHVAALCRGSDTDRAPKFRRVIEHLGATGSIGDLDDGPRQRPLPDAEVEAAVETLLPGGPFDLVLTHGPLGEYTRHRRHEECCHAVTALWAASRIETAAMWLFAYEDAGRTRLPAVRADADRRDRLPEAVWREKRRIITDLYGFGDDTWEARAVPAEEGFWCCATAAEASRRVSGVEVAS